MISSLAAHLALRNRALSCVVATTGSMTLSATATGYARASGSFVTDKFAAGMELTPVGFGVNTPCIVSNVSASLLTIVGGLAVDAPAAARSLSVGLPLIPGYQNASLTPIQGRPYFEEEFVPGTHTLQTIPAQGGQVEETGLYVLRWYGLANYGVAALYTAVDALKALFAPGTNLTAGSNTLRIRSDTAVRAGSVTPLGNGMAYVSLTVPWRAWSSNLVAA